MCCAIISMALSRLIDSLIETLSSSWKASNHSRRVSLLELARRFSIRWTSREKMSATSLAQVSQYFRSPHFSTTLAKIAPGGRSSGGKDSSRGLEPSPRPSIPSPLKIIRSVGVSLRSILLISASNRSSCERSARKTPQTTANRSLSSRALSGSTPAGTATGSTM